MIRSFVLAATLAAGTLSTINTAGAQVPLGADRGGATRTVIPLVIGHRGVAGHLPDHTLEGYALAIELGADFIEPDLVATQDGHLIARHEPNLIATTDVSRRPEFASRKRRMLVDGLSEEGWFASDFTLAEIKTLRAIQPLAERNPEFNGRFAIPTLAEVLALVRRKSAETGRRIGVYPETKHPSYHARLGLALEDRLLEELSRAGMNHREAPVYIQSFEVGNLQYLRSRTRVKLVQLIDGDDVGPDGQVTLAAPYDKPYDWAVAGDARSYKDMLTPAGLRQIASYADGIGPWKPYLIGAKCIKGTTQCEDANGDGLVNDADRVLLPASNVVRDAHAAGLVVHPYTFRNEPRRLASDYHGMPAAEAIRFYELGVDGLFTDFTETAVAARHLYLLKNVPGYAECLKETRAARGRECKALGL